jgi:hypothetical protein
MPLATTVVSVNADTPTSGIVGSTSIQMGIYRITFTATYPTPLSGCGGVQMRLKLNTVEVAAAPYFVPTANGVYQLTYVFVANGTTNYFIEAEIDNAIPQ